MDTDSVPVPAAIHHPDSPASRDWQGPLRVTGPSTCANGCLQRRAHGMPRERVTHSLPFAPQRRLHVDGAAAPCRCPSPTRLSCAVVRGWDDASLRTEVLGGLCADRRNHLCGARPLPAARPCATSRQPLSSMARGGVAALPAAGRCPCSGRRACEVDGARIKACPRFARDDEPQPRLFPTHPRLSTESSLSHPVALFTSRRLPAPASFPLARVPLPSPEFSLPW